MANKRTTKLVDFHKGRHGVFVEKVLQDENGNNLKPDPSADADRVCKVKFYEEVDIGKSPIRWLKALFGLVDPVVTEDKFPEEAVYTTTLDPDRDGKPREVCVIEEDQYGNAPFADKLDKKHERQISAVQRQRAQAKGDADMQKLDEFGQDDGQKDDSSFKKRKSPREGMMTDFGAEEEARYR